MLVGFVSNRKFYVGSPEGHYGHERPIKLSYGIKCIRWNNNNCGSVAQLTCFMCLCFVFYCLFHGIKRVITLYVHVSCSTICCP